MGGSLVESGPARAGRRLFFALWPSDEFRDQIEAATREVVQASGGRLIPPRNFHVTLLFLGNVSPTDFQSVQQAGERLVGSPAFELIFDGIEAWPLQRIHAPAGSSRTSMCPLHLGILPGTFGRPAQQGRKVLSATTSITPDAASALAEQLRAGLAALIQQPAEHEFRPHITLARDLARGLRRQPLGPLRMKVNDFVLVESVPDVRGSQYSVLTRWSLL